MKAGFFTASLLVLSLVFVSSVSMGQSLTPLTPAERAARTAALAHTPWDGKSANKGSAQEQECSIRVESIQVEDPVTKTTHSYDLRLYLPWSKHQVPVVIIVPTILGTQDYVEPVVAHSLCVAGIGSIIADVNDVSVPAHLPDWGGEDVNSRRAILALETVVDFAQSVPAYDPTRVGALGISLGGITTALWAGVDPRLKASVVIVGGGNLPYILSHSDESRVVELREKRMQAGGLRTVDEYNAALRSNILLDPFYFAPQADHHRILMVMADEDTKVPYVVQQEQYAAFGKPQSLTFSGGHEFTIGMMVYLYMDDVTKFLNEKFDPAVSLMAQPITHKVVYLDRHGRVRR